MKLTDLTWPEVQNLNREAVIIYPLASLEQHSRHLPLFTDSILCGAVAERVEAALPDETLLMPLQWLGASAHHLGMPGSLSASVETFLGAICEPLRCLFRHGFHRAFILNGHGGNADVWHLALRQLKFENPELLVCGADYWDLADKELAAILKGSLKSMGHACEAETSLMMHLRPELVRHADIADDGCTRPAEACHGIYFPLDMKQQTGHGGLGQATAATAETGRALFEVIVARAVGAVKALGSTPASQGP